jgi:hypothetical protein
MKVHSQGGSERLDGVQASREGFSRSLTEHVNVKSHPPPPCSPLHIQVDMDIMERPEAWRCLQTSADSLQVPRHWRTFHTWQSGD